MLTIGCTGRAPACETGIGNAMAWKCGVLPRLAEMGATGGGTVGADIVIMAPEALAMDERTPAARRTGSTSNTGLPAALLSGLNVFIENCKLVFVPSRDRLEQ